MNAPAPLAESVDLLWPPKRTGIQTQAWGCLRRAGIDTVGELTGKTKRDLLELPAFGPRCLTAVRLALAARGLHLFGEEVAS